MDKEIKFLYDQIKEGKMLRADAAQQLKLIAAQHKPQITSLPIEEDKAVPTINHDLLREKSINYFKKLLSSVTKLPVSNIEDDAPLDNYGIDSIMIMQLTNQLEKAFGSLSKTLFFEYQNIETLTGYFLESYQEQLIGLLGIEEKTARAVDNSKELSVVKESVEPSVISHKHTRFTTQHTQVQNDNSPATLDIAIIGISGRYPGARNVQEFWQNLSQGTDSIIEIPKDRWDHSLYFDADKNKPGKTYSKWGGFIDGVDQFDPLFFNISPREAEFMDPQERLFLECAFATIEDAGYTRELLGRHQQFGLDGNVGVYVGVMYEEYQLYGAQEQIMGTPFALPGNPASIANRVSHFCNFHGPSMTIDTMCSSSLTAIHLACQSLQRDGCEVAIAGGVNVSIHPNKYLLLGQGKFVSSKGRCESFGEGGDGYVPGEGVGAVLLKPLPKAIADGDHIYGIIKGTAINHGGKTNGFSVPNPNAQASVIGRAINEAGIDPRAISYIEAHGTGTSLGDPIEIAGLTKSFQEYTRDKQFCAIGSAKSNIGHCESAAGIAGVTKIIMQLKHGQIAPSLHSRTLNPNIDFSNTPFVVQQELTEWKRPVVEIDGQAREYSRIAGISAFGAGGSNAHIVIEEYIPTKQQSAIEISAQNPVMIVLSAKNADRLKEQAQQLLAAITQQQFAGSSLTDMAYTLQVGREAMEERLAMAVGSIKELEEKLQGFVGGLDSIEDLYRGQVKPNKETLGIFAADEDLQKAIEAWINKGKYGKLLDLWVKGMSFDWNKLYGTYKPSRMSLPTYPFVKDSYWFPHIGAKSAHKTLKTSANGAVIHPLVQQNISNISGLGFTSTFTGQEFFLSDHVVKGQKILPSVAYLEMARAAVEQATEEFNKEQTRIVLTNVVWARPIVVGEEPLMVNIGLYPENIVAMDFEIYSQPEAGMAQPIVHSQGRAVLRAATKVPMLDLKAVQLECTHSSWSGVQCYEIFKSMGIEYGPGHQGIELVYVGAEQVLAKLCLPTCITDTQDQFVLHPSLMDSALQASSGVMMLAEEARSKGALSPSLPFALQELEIIGKCTSNMWALIECTDIHTAGDKVQKSDITLCDEQGNVCIRMKGLSSRILAGVVATSATIGTLILEPDWQEQEVQTAITHAYTQHVVVLCEMDKNSRESIESSLSMVRCLTLQAEEQEVDKRFQTYAQQVFIEIKTILQNKPKGNVLVQIVTSGQGEQELTAGLAGLLKTAQLENPKLMGQLIEVGEDSSRIVEILIENSQSPVDRQIRYQDGKRLVCYWKETQVLKQASLPWKDHGIYLITGGAGGLGQIFANEIAHKVKDVTLILTGRSSLSETKKTQLNKLKALGARIEYQEVDVTQRQAVRDLLQHIQEKFGSLHGIIHSAGVNRDNFIFKKTSEELQAVLTPKVTGLVNLDIASRELHLDFFILFSSIAGSLGNSGQADYSTANAFMDAYAHYRNKLVDSNQRQGRTLSINWPLWKEGGMHINEETEKAMSEHTGIIPMETLSGIKALYQGLASGKSQVMIMEGELSRMQECIVNPLAKERTESVQVALSPVDSGVLREKTVHQLKNLFGEISKLTAKQIDMDEPFESYGIDSIMITQMNQKLAEVFGELSKTLFFEYQTLGALSKYFIAEYAQACMKWTGLEKQVKLVSKVPSEVFNIGREIPMLTTLKGKNKTVPGFSAMAESHGSREPIAIIGMSGRYPQAGNLKEYWDNLQGGKDCITEIPRERWKLDGFYNASRHEAIATGKSYSKWGGFVDGFADFEPLFFNMSPRETLNIDPQERIFIEACWEVIEDAGYTREQLSAQYNRRVGVFAGITKTGFSLYGPDLWRQGEDLFPSTSFSSVANRVSYLFNLQGPSMPIDTMCSSSLTAIHEACEHLQHGDCEMAIAGGVNLYLHPSSYIGLCAQQMLSADGQCKSFGQGGNGFVPGEGAGCVLLKPLARAVADNDHIYAVIHGTSINHDGKTNGYTVPSPTAQGEVIRQALDKAGVNARTVSYIEAHGTGTELGDPIEISGLTQAFRKDSQDTGFCAIGSAKSNIGHLEAAAGIAGLSKIVLQMQHKKLVPSLHSTLINPNIKFSQTPFVVQQELAEWKRPVVSINGTSREYPRIAGISAFGAGGSNAHVVIEEYISKNKAHNIIRINVQNPAIIVLSAKNEESLRKQAKRLLAAVVAQEFTEDSLADMAYTLQVGREAMEERLAVFVGSLSELEEKLTGFVAGKDGIEDLYQGQVKRNKEALAVFAADDDMAPIIDTWISKKKYGKLLDLWVKGLIFDWQKLYGDALPCRISLPTYAFAKERYWIPEIKSQAMDSVALGSTLVAFIHPLLHKNTSNVFGLEFCSTFTGEEFFLADHIVTGQRVLPGVAYLEMVREAVKQTAGDLIEDQTTIKLKNVVWARPIVVGEKPVQVHISLIAEENEEISYEIYTEKDVVHSQGNAVLSTRRDTPILNIKALREECTKGSLTSTECYEAFKKMGLDYGLGYQGIEGVYVGEDQVLAKLTLPSSVAESQDQFIVHPSLMDSALQSSIGLMMLAKDSKDENTFKPVLPFALEELEILGQCTRGMWALIRYTKENKAGDKLQKIDVDLCDEQGYVCIRMKGFSSRVLEGEVGLVEALPAAQTLILEPSWKEQTIQEGIAPAYDKRVVLLCETDEICSESIESNVPGVRCRALKVEQEEIDKRFQSYALQVFAEIKAILCSKPKNKVLVQIVTSGLGERQLFAGLAGLLRTAQLENPKLIGQLIEVGEESSRIVEILEENSRSPIHQQIRYQADKCLVAYWKEVEVLEKANHPWKDHGIYLITGGAGGLGQIFANEIAHKVKNATLILTGRSTLSETKKTQLKNLEDLGIRVEYHEVDVTKPQAVRDLLHNIQEKFGTLTGIIHGAGILRDNFIIKKNPEELQAVLAPKVTGLVNLDLASRELPLDFFIFFSSIAGSLGNPGQADYSTANAFMDAYAQYRNILVAGNERQGMTLSINWPLWKDGGMHIDAETEKIMAETTGITTMQTSTGIWALYQGLTSSKSQIMVMEGDVKLLRAAFLERPAESEFTKALSSTENKIIVPAISHDVLQGKAVNYFKKLLSSVIKLPASKIEGDAPLEHYGIDSIMIMQLTNQLEKTFGSLSKTLFFEYQNIETLTGYFLESYREQLIGVLGIEEKATATSEKSRELIVVTEPVKSSLSSRKHARFATLRTKVQIEKTSEALDIAIIGISGRYPGARNVGEFWQNLSQGMDSITEIPIDRWDHSLYFDADKNKHGKTYSKWGGFLNGVDQFDPLFFNISPREALIIDPQERLFLECAFATIEDAGYTRESLGNHQEFGLDGNVGVYVGVMYEEYQLYGAEEQIMGRPIALSGSAASIANRVSHLCNFHGPSMTLDTMCSSSLTAIHLACQSLQRDECELAIAGGVNVSIHPNKYLMLSQGKFVSSKGRCESFGEGGDGYVPGEGVGAVLLKPLSKAIADGDHIYGVIKGTAINHGGKNNGYSVPSPKAQASVIGRAFKDAGIDPRAISYIEAHGTGTSLGDPIEIAGLTKTFQQYTKAKQFCAIGSVKSNIGHCESAAGIAGVTKIIMQLKHGKIAPSLHSKTLNPNIDFSNTPFVVQQELTEWKRPVVEIDGQTREYPRIAGISAFGAGGSNAHIVIEEYVPIKQQRSSIEVTVLSPVIIILSAKNEERLTKQVQQLLSTVEAQKFSDNNLVDIAYTLQVGREAMEERLAIVVSSMQELEEKLQRFMAGQDGIEDLYRGQVKRNKETVAVFAADEDMKITIDAWISKRKYDKLLDLWVKGLSFNWQKLYGEFQPCRISLPTYPFARERYWILDIVRKADGITRKNSDVTFLHPLLHRNTSDLSKQQFSSTFTGKEFFLADHVVTGHKVLPGIASLEMAREAVKQAAGEITENQTTIRLKNVVWARSIAIGAELVQVHIGLFPEDKDEIAYEIYSEQDVIHSQGSAVLSSSKNPPMLDIKGLQAECTQGSLTSAECFEVLRTLRLEYNLGDQGLEQVYVGQGQFLAKLSLPASVTASLDQFILHPSVMDATLQAVIAVMANDTHKALQPAKLQEIQFFSKCTANMWAFIRDNSSNAAGAKVQNLDITLCDAQGTVCVQMKGLSMEENMEVPAENTLVSAAPQHAVAVKAKEAFEIMTFEEIWQEETLINKAAITIKTMVCFLSDQRNQQNVREELQKLDTHTQVVFISQGTTYGKESSKEYRIVRDDLDTYRRAFQSIQDEYFEVDALLYLWELEDPSCIEDYSIHVYILQAMAGAKLLIKRLLSGAQFSNGLQRCYLESWIGFERSLGLVLPSTQVAVIYQEAMQENQERGMREWLKKLWAELQTDKMQSALYQNGKRYVYQVRSTSLQVGDSLLRAGETYLITGGCGGLGLLFAQHFAKKHPVKLILTGRSPMDADKQRKIKALEALGSQVAYVQADVCDARGMKAGLHAAQERFGKIHGVIHAAGIEGKENIFEKELGKFEQVIAPKIQGTLVLDELLAEEPLDFMCYFSSSSAILGDFGACDYAVGNRFQMAYAHYRKEQGYQGKTVVINWPLWKDGGMSIGEQEDTKMYLKTSGQRLLEAEEGTNLFERILNQPNTQNLVMVGEPSRVHRFLGLAEQQARSSTLEAVNVRTVAKGRRAEMKGLSVKQCVEWDLKEAISQILRISRDKLDREENLADFGFDSISLTELAKALTSRYSIDISPAVFFGHSTIEKLTHYFMTEQQEIIDKVYQEEVVGDLILPSVLATVATPRKRGPIRSRFATGNGVSFSEPIAIIGMSGRFPQARNIDELWAIIRDGRDVIQEISEDRFNDVGLERSQWRCGWVPGISEFDPLFFEISPREAETMDPRQRLLLQEAWKALEDAGYGPRQIKNSKIGMFVGVEDGDYHHLVQDKGSITSNHNAILAARLSYFLNLNGPNMAINTACSSGLVATHQACQSLRNQECDTAIAAGVNLMLTPISYMGMSQAGMLSQEGKCYAFDKRASGMVPGEAVAVVVLKTLSKAREDGDPIYAVIQGNGINYDGKTNGITAPSGVSQTQLLKNVYEQYKVNPEEIEYIVTHGTGTKLGDPIEINALYDAFKDYTQKQGYCALTSTKTNIGHTLAASGLVSLISLVQAFCHKTIPASLHCEQENDFINWQKSPFYVNKENKPWRSSKGKERIGAVSAFGMSGTNVHMVVQSYTEEHSNVSTRAPYYLLALSAKTPGALQEKVHDMIKLLENKGLDGKHLAAISYTLLEGRKHFEYRYAVVVQDRESAVYTLKQAGGTEKLPNLFIGKVARDFTGQKVIEQYAQDLLAQSTSLQDNQPKYQQILYALAEFYCQGYEILWSTLYGVSEPQRINLPTYPFEKECYWVEQKPIENTSFAIENTVQYNDAFYEKSIDNILNNTTSVDDVAQEIKKFISK